MMHAKIYSGGSQQKRSDSIAKELTDLKVLPSDTLRLELDEEKERIGIAQVREFTRRMILGPTASPYMIGIIENAELLTTESQNALLKIIE
jgi:DNA polymerase III delta prime subunit